MKKLLMASVLFFVCFSARAELVESDFTNHRYMVYESETERGQRQLLVYCGTEEMEEVFLLNTGTEKLPIDAKTRKGKRKELLLMPMMALYSIHPCFAESKKVV